MEDEDDNKRPLRIAGGDLGVIALALIFTGGFLYLALGPSPFADLYRKAPPAIAKPSPEVTVGIAPKPKN